MKSDDTPKVRAVEKEVQSIMDAFERLIDLGVPALRMDLIIDHLRNKYGYKGKSSMINNRR